MSVEHTETPPEAPCEDLERGALRFWFYEGVVLEAADHSLVSTSDLLEFAQYAQKHYPGSKVQVHAYGLRVTKTAGTVGPRLEWRDWD